MTCFKKQSGGKFGCLNDIRNETLQTSSLDKILRCLMLFLEPNLSWLIRRLDWNSQNKKDETWVMLSSFANPFVPVGCFYQLGASSTSTGKVLSSFIQTYTTAGNIQCSVVCNSQNFNFYGTVNVGATSVDCYCGDTLNFVSTYWPDSSPPVWTRFGDCVIRLRVWEFLHDIDADLHYFRQLLQIWDLEQLRIIIADSALMGLVRNPDHFLVDSLVWGGDACMRREKASKFFSIEVLASKKMR